MGKIKYDGVVEAVHYDSEGQVVWVRVYRRRGPTFSDRILLDRNEFIKELKAGRRYYSGKRIPLKASTFELGRPVKLIEQNGKEILAIGDRQPEGDCLDGVPII